MIKHRALFALTCSLVVTAGPVASWAQTPPPGSTTTSTTSTTTTTTTTTTEAPPPPPPTPPPPPPPPPPPAKDAKYEFGKYEDVKAVEWKATASVGFSATTGNSNVISLSGGADVSRNDGTNKLALHAEGVYGFTRSLAFTDLNGNGLADAYEEDTVGKTTAAFFAGRLRYDRFFTPNNSVYLTALGGFDLPASKQAIAGVQVGYARQVLKSKMHELSAELGYDFTYNRLIPPDTVPDSFLRDIYLHSGRIFVGYVLAVNGHTEVRAAIEALINFNPLHIGDRDVGIAEATRVNGRVELTTKIWKPLSFRAAFTARFNNAPALNTSLKFAPDNVDRYNQSLDTLTELGLVVNFL